MELVNGISDNSKYINADGEDDENLHRGQLTSD